MASERQITVGNVPIGGGAPVVVQSMTLTKTHDVDATMAQIGELVSAGCEVVRVAVPKNEDAEALPKLVYLSPIPVIADIHFNASLALKAVDAGVAAVRINPGNIGGPDRVAEVVNAAKGRGIPMRIGANSGSLPKHRRAGPGGHGRGARRGGARAGAAARVDGLLRLQDLGQVELGADDDPRLPHALGEGALPAPPRRHRGGHARERLDQERDRRRQPAHGRDRRHDPDLATADPVEEVKVAWEILKALGLRERGPIMIACPSCGRDNVGVWNLAEAVEERLRAYPQAFEVAVMGCAVNGPGEAGDADFGVAGARRRASSTRTGVCSGRSSRRCSSTSSSARSTWIEGGMVGRRA